MSSLEAKIKALLEGKSDETISEDEIESLEEKETITTKGGTKIVDDTDKDQDDSDAEDDSDEDGDDENSDDTEYSKDVKKDKAEVVDEETTGMKQGADNVSGAADTAKIKAGVSRKDEVKSGKLTNDTSTGDIKSHDVKMMGSENGGEADTAKIKAGVSRKDEVKTGKLAKISVQEHLDAMFAGEDLSDEFKSKIATIFEAAVEATAQAKFEAMEAEYSESLNEQAESTKVQIDEAVEEVKSELVENVDGFLNYVVEQWVTDNKVALQSGVKVDLIDSFIDGMKNLFKEHYIEVPEEKLDIVQDQSETIAGLTEEIGTLESMYEKLAEELISVKRESLFNTVSAGMTAVQISKFKDLAESVEFNSDEDYVNKLATIKESYFAPKTVDTKTTELVEDANVGSTGNMNAYVSAISKNVKFV